MRPEITFCAVMMFTSCSSSAVPASSLPVPAIEPVGVESLHQKAGPARLQKPDAFAAAKQRPGLGTGWGKKIKSSLGNTHFDRASDRPIGGVATIFYNDREGVEAMAPYRNETRPYQRAANETVEWGVKSGWGNPDHYMAGSRRLVVGKKGRHYSLVVRNLSNSRLEIVLSVDGLDVVDGQAASFRKRGYILAPNEKIEVKGFRTSYDAVAAFKFSAVSASYSNLRHATSRDVGVFGLAVFAEKGREPWRWSQPETTRREQARPFAEAPLRTVR